MSLAEAKYSTSLERTVKQSCDSPRAFAHVSGLSFHEKKTVALLGALQATTHDAALALLRLCTLMTEVNSDTVH